MGYAAKRMLCSCLFRATVLATLAALSASQGFPGPADQKNTEPSFQKGMDPVWAKRSGLATTQITQLRRLSGIADDDHISYLANIDAKSFRAHREILVATAEGSGHYLGIYLFAKSKSGFRKVWESGEELALGGFNLAEGSLSCVVSAHGTAEGEIIAVDKCADGTAVGIYKWSGKTFVYQGQHPLRESRPKRR